MDKEMLELEETIFQYVDDNLNTVANWTTLGEDNITHIKMLARDLVFARENIFMPGGFISAILDNDLEKVLNYADEITFRSLKLLMLVKHNVHKRN